MNAVPKYLPLPYQYPDIVHFVQDKGVLSYHHNSKTPLFDFQAKQQKLADANSYFNPMRNNTASPKISVNLPITDVLQFGIYMHSPQMHQGGTTTGKYLNTKFTSFNLVSREACKAFQLYIGVDQEQTVNVDAWKTALIAKAESMPSQKHCTTISWWHAFWDRSYILINPNADLSDPGFQVGKNYQYFRYMMGCNARGKYPTRFNGGLFTFDPVLTDKDYPFTPDFRLWSGGTFTAQNQRLLYWPLLKTGDWDIMQRTTPSSTLGHKFLLT